MRVVVTGSREWTNRALLDSTLNQIHQAYGIEVVFHGEQTGADIMARQWCEARGIPNFGCPYAGFYGKRGGQVRNGWLLKFGQPDLVVAFPTPASVGTWDCVQEAKRKGIRIRIVAGTVRPKNDRSIKPVTL